MISKHDISLAKLLAKGAAKRVFEENIILAVEHVDEFLRQEDGISQLISDGVIDENGFKLLKKFFEEENPTAHTIAPSSTVTSKDYEPWLFGTRLTNMEWQYHDRLHEYLEKAKKFNPIVLREISKETKDILDLCGDPKAEGDWLRKGLVFGYVQSGKTTNYADVIARSMDAGYKVFIVMAGITNSLRLQTQERLEDYVIGKITLRDGRYASDFRELPKPNSPTRSKDFNKSRDVSLNLDNSNGTIFVIKKNVSVLNSLIDELDIMRGNQKIDLPTLIIDDEADNATINTATVKSKYNITAINNNIRKLLNCFSKRVYLGYTATPFANIFIDHETDEKLRDSAENSEDLFPSNFIKSISAPNYYLGANRLFHIDEQDVDKSLKHTVGIISRHNFDPILPLKHKQYEALSLKELPTSLYTAIKYFYLFCAIQHASGKWDRHHTMMVNVSRFNAVQDVVQLLIEEFNDNILNSVKYSAGLVDGRDDLFTSLKKLYFKGSDHSQIQYEHVSGGEIPYAHCIETEDLDFEEDIVPSLLHVSGEIKVQTVNMQRSPLEYPEKKPQHVIAIGGLALSRGLTLEGLAISYILRNASASDTLMQMGRWFGYRQGYENLTRVFLPQTSFNHYCAVNTGTEELRSDLEEMERFSKTPLDFGLKVRNSETGIAITARNKLQSAEVITVKRNFSSSHKQAYTLSKDKKIRLQNEENILNFLSKCINEQSDIKNCEFNDGWVFEADGHKVFDLIKELQFPKDPNFGAADNLPNSNGDSSRSFIEKYIQRRIGESLSEWRICIPKGSRDTLPPISDMNIEFKRRNRTSGQPLTDEQHFKVNSGESVAMGSDLLIGISETDRKLLNAKKGKKAANIADHLSKPTLFIHFLKCEMNNEEVERLNISREDYDGKYSSISILFNVSNLDADKHQYTANKIYMVQSSIDDADQDLDDDHDKLLEDGEL